MKRYHLLVSSLLLCAFSHSQEVVASQGDSYSNGSGSIDFTIGEVVVKTISDGSNTITQGFHQTNWNFVGVESLDPSIEVSIFPNPTSDVLMVKTSEHENLDYRFYDAQGKLIFSGTLTGEITSLNVKNLAVGQYSISLVNKNQKTTKTFKLIKTH